MCQLNRVFRTCAKSFTFDHIVAHGFKIRSKVSFLTQGLKLERFVVGSFNG